MYPSMLKSTGGWFADFDQLQEQFDQLFGGRDTNSSIRAVSRAGAFPALNVGNHADALEIYAFAPGVDPKSVDVSVEKGLLAITGERVQASKRAEDRSVYASERFAGRFRRVISLPEDADPTKVDASYRNGVLKIVVPKRESSKPRQIPIAS
jgi:HSP20 family protein